MSNNTIPFIEQLIRAGEYEKTETACIELLDENNNNADAFSKLGEIYLLQGKEIEAQIFFEKVRKLKSNKDKIGKNGIIPNQISQTFLKENDLVFDIGANIGNKVEEYLALNCKVVAIELQPESINILKSKFADNENVTIVGKGLSDKEEVLKLSICSEANTISTFSDKWKKGRFSNYKWDKSIEVEMTTLDQLIDMYGIPKFCKIDVEGFEYNVLKGLEMPIEYISFEYTGEAFENAKKCVFYLNKICDYKFNYTLGETSVFVLSDWVKAEDLFNSIQSNSDKLIWGDIYAKRINRELKNASNIINNESIIHEFMTKNLWKPNEPLRLHLGCGEQYFNGYVNIDYPLAEHSVQQNSEAEYFTDIVKMHFPASSVDEIRLHHVFEHFDRPTALAQLIRWHEWLKIGGKLHIETPDILGCSSALMSDISYSQKQAILRHAFGSHEASWAYHYDGWYDEKYKYILSQLGFEVTCNNWHWDHFPFLPNVDSIAIKNVEMSRDQLLCAADAILGNSMVVDARSEHKMHEVWCKNMRDALNFNFHIPQVNSKTLTVLPSYTTNKALQNSSEKIKIFTNTSEFNESGYDNDQSETNGEYKVVKYLIKANDMVFDVGANVGRWSQNILSNIPGIRLHAFEPVPESFNLLKTSLKDFSASAHEVAISNIDGKSTFYYYNKTSQIAEMSSFYRRFEVERNFEMQPLPIEIYTKRLDSFCSENNINKIDYLKIDTEGNEFNVLQGATHFLNKNKIKILQFEYGGTYKDAESTLIQVWQLLSQNEYTLFRILPKGLLHIPNYNPDLENFRYSNYLATAPEVTKQILPWEY